MHCSSLQPDLSPAAVDQNKRLVRDRYPSARWITDGYFGRIVAGDRLISLKLSLIDPDAESLGWFDAASRLGSGNELTARQYASRDL